MPVMAFYSVGNSELELDGVRLPPGTQRESAQELLRNFATVKGRLRFLLLEPCLRYILARHPALDRLFLFGTDQPEAMGNQRQSDTVYVAQVLAKFVRETFPSSGPLEKKRGVTRVTPLSIQGDVSSYDEVYAWFRRTMATAGPDDWSYLCPTGGTPAMTLGLLLCGILCSREHCSVLYVPRGSLEAEERPFAAAFLGDLRRERLVQALEFRDFSGACGLLEGQGGWIGPLCRYASCRLRSRFSPARLALDQAISLAGGTHQAQLRPIRDGLLKELQLGSDQEFVQKVPALLEELYYNARVAWAQERYDDFLVRLVRFEEVCARYLVEKYLELPTDERKGRRDFVTKVETNKDLSDYLKSGLVDQETLDYQKMNVPTFLALVGYAAKRGLNGVGQPLAPDVRGNLERLDTLLAAMDGLRGWRNDIVHDFRGVSREDLLQQYRREAGAEGSPLEDMRAALELLGRRSDRDPFAETARIIRAAL